MEFKSKEEYLLALSEALKYLPLKDQNKVLNYYNTRIDNSIDYGKKLEQVLNELPSIEDVAKETYESHGINYLEKRKKQLKVKNVVNKIVNTILLTIIFIAFLTLISLFYGSLFKGFSFYLDIFNLNNILNIVLSLLSFTFMVITLFIASIYIIDLFYILSTSFFIPLLKCNEDTKRKIKRFTINESLDILLKKKNILFKSLVSSFVFFVFFCICSYATKGYVYNSLTNTPTNSFVLDVSNEYDIYNIEVVDTAVRVIKSETNTFKATYIYELTNEVSINENTIKCNKSKTYDLVNIFKEPTPVLLIEAPDNISLNILGVSSSITLSEVNLNNISIDLSNGNELVIHKSLVNTITSNNTLSYCGIVSSKITTLNIKSVTKQFIISDNTEIDNLEVTSTALVDIKDTKINHCIFDQSMKEATFTNISGHDLVYTTKATKNYFYDFNYSLVTIKEEATSFISIIKGSIKYFNAKVSSSYLTLDDIMYRTIDIDASFANLILSNVVVDFLTSAHYDDKVTIKNSGDTAKTDVQYSQIPHLDINQTKGYVIVSNSDIGSSCLSGTNLRILELLNLKGNKLDISLVKVKDYTKITSEQQSNIIFNFINVDDYTLAGVVKDENVIINEENNNK